MVQVLVFYDVDLSTMRPAPVKWVVGKQPEGRPQSLAYQPPNNIPIQFSFSKCCSDPRWNNPLFAFPPSFLIPCFLFHPFSFFASFFFNNLLLFLYFCVLIFIFLGFVVDVPPPTPAVCSSRHYCMHHNTRDTIACTRTHVVYISSGLQKTSYAPLPLPSSLTPQPSSPLPSVF